MWDSSQGTVHRQSIIYQHNLKKILDVNILHKTYYNYNQLITFCHFNLKSNGTHFIYENTIQGDVDPHEGLISRQRNIHLRFCCEYPLAQALSMAVGINPVER